jgi:outer membrane protein assembly factor BamB
MPLISGLPHSRGRVMLSAVDTAFDDPARRNGVLTAAVIDGLRCGATYPRGWITGQTLAEYVEHNVRAWIVKNRNREVASAIQISIDGQARNMRLVKCWGDDFPMAPAFDGSKLYAYSPDRSKLLWQTDLGSPITGAQQAKAEIVASTADQLLAFDRAGNRIWSANEGAPLRAFAVVDLLRKHKLQVVALWGSRVAIYDAGSGRLRATHDYPQPLERIAIYQPTKHYNPRIVVAAANRLFCVDADAKPVWSGRLKHAVASLAFRDADADADAKCDIAVTTSGGNTILLDARGHVIGRHSGREFVLDRHLK